MVDVCRKQEAAFTQHSKKNINTVFFHDTITYLNVCLCLTQLNTYETDKWVLKIGYKIQIEISNSVTCIGQFVFNSVVVNWPEIALFLPQPWLRINVKCTKLKFKICIN